MWGTVARKTDCNVDRGSRVVLADGHIGPAARLLSSRSRGDLHAFGICKNLHHGVGPQAPAFPISASVKGRPNRLRDPPHMAVASDARCDRRGKPGESIDDLAGKYRSRGTRIHVVHGHDNFVGRIVVNPDVELIIAEGRRSRQRQRKAEHIDRSITSPTHSRHSRSQGGEAVAASRAGLPCRWLPTSRWLPMTGNARGYSRYSQLALLMAVEFANVRLDHLL